MSRRDGREHRSRIDYEPSSPKRSRRDGKPEAERVLSKKDLDVREGGKDTEKKPRQPLRDAAPLEPDTHGSREDSANKRSGHRETTKISQHDDLRSDGKGDRRATSERGSWRSSRDQSNRRAEYDEKSQNRKDEDKRSWRHDRFHETDNTHVARKRPAFRETKIPEESRNNTRDKTRTEEAKDTNLNSHRQNERTWRSNMHSERHERPAMGGRDRAWNRDDERSGVSRQSYRADRDSGFSRNRQTGLNGSWTREEKKWDHDLFEEANKSPTRATEEEQIAKVEALLAS